VTDLPAMQCVFRAVLRVAACGVLAGTTGLQAQSRSRSVDPDQSARWSVWSGLAWQTPRIFGDTPDRDLFLFAARYRRPFRMEGQVGVAYVLDVLPVMLLGARYFDVERTLHPPCERGCVSAASAVLPVASANAHALGFGVSPLGLEVSWPRAHSPQLALNTGAGFATFSRDVPVDGARKLNVTAHIGMGIRVATRSAGILTFGYKLHHLSNAGTALNPGLDSSVWFVSWGPRE